MSRMALAYSGGLRSSVAIRWLAERHRADVIAVTMDLGQGKDVLEEVRDRALATGALRAHVVDVRDAYVRDYLLRGLKAGILERDGVSMAGALAQPLIAQKLVEIARIEQADAAAHGDGAAHDAPLERTLRAIDPSLAVVAPAAEWAMSADQLVEYAADRRVTLPAAMIGGIATRSTGAAPSEPAFVEVGFEKGIPLSINGVTMPLADLIGSVSILAAAHGVAAGALGVLHMAHEALRSTATSADGAPFHARAGDEYLRVLHDGVWFARLRHALDAYVDAIEQDVAGVARLKLFTERCTVDACRVSPLKPVTVMFAKASRR
jgi:argininosuccinate synthase